jgi:hypothetical protein
MACNCGARSARARRLSIKATKKATRLAAAGVKIKKAPAKKAHAKKAQAKKAKPCKCT